MTTAITSMPHQRAIMDHLVASCPQQRGILIAHQMGGGKTLTALMFLRNFPRSKHVIVSPPFLRDLYDRESKKLLGRPLKEGTVLLNYDEFVDQLVTNPTIFEKCVLVMDEAHYLIEAFSKAGPRVFINAYGALLRYPKKTLVMTGTPMYDSVKDLRLLINLAAGKEVMPLRDAEFINMYTAPRYFNTMFWGYFVGSLTSAWTGMVGTGMLVYMGVVLGKDFDFTKIMSRGTVSIFETILVKVNHFPNSISMFQKFMLPNIMSLVPSKKHEAQDKKKRGSWWGPQLQSPLLKDFKPTPDELKSTEALAEAAWRFVLKDPDTSAYLRSITDKDKQKYWVTLLVSLSIMSLWTCLFLLTLLYNRVSNNQDPMFYRQLNYSKLRDKIAPYLSFYKLKQCTHGIPKTSEQEVNIPYNGFQMRMWTRMIYNYLTDQDTRDLGITRKDLKYNDGVLGTAARQVDLTTYTTWGRMISNTAPAGEFAPKYHECYANMCNPWPNKLPRATVVYSDFARGTETFADFMQEKSQNQTLFRYATFTMTASSSEKTRLLDDFANDKIQVIILHAGIYEGISFLRAAQMHILDPPTNFKSLMQLMGRVVRMHSHDGLPPARQTVKYFHYIANFHAKYVNMMGNAANLLGAKTAYLMEFMKIWTQSQTFKQKLPLGYAPTILETLTPEALAFSRLRPLRELMTNLETKLATQVVLPRMTCRPRYDRDDITDHLNLPPCDFV